MYKSKCMPLKEFDQFLSSISFSHPLSSTIWSFLDLEGQRRFYLWSQRSLENQRLMCALLSIHRSSWVGCRNSTRRANLVPNHFETRWGSLMCCDHHVDNCVCAPVWNLWVFPDVILVIFNQRKFGRNFRVTDSREEMRWDSEISHMGCQLDSEINHMGCQLDSEINHMWCQLDSEIKHMWCHLDSEINHMWCQLDSEIKHMWCHLDSEINHMWCQLESEINHMWCQLQHRWCGWK